jgi:hypothetical protein
MQLSKPSDPFGEVNVYKQPNGEIEIVATILMTPDIEGARTGLALDASASMKAMYGVGGNPLFGGPPNLVEPVAQTMTSYLANFSSTGKCHVIYWAVNPDGTATEPLGDFDATGAKMQAFTGPTLHPWGRGTKLLPPVKHFVETEFKDAPWSICVFVTDGVIEDLQDVKAYCLEFGKKIAAGDRAFTKLVLLGVGAEVDEGQMEELDDMFEGSGLVDKKGDDIDLWDHTLAAEMKSLEEVFKEVVSKDTIVAPSARVFDNSGSLVHEYADGLPAIMRFRLPAGATSFKVEFPGGSVTQDISEGLVRV